MVILYPVFPNTRVTKSDGFTDGKKVANYEKEFDYNRNQMKN